MMENGVQRVKVWSGAVRVAHWVMALSVLVLLFTGFALRSFPQDGAYLDYHYLAGYGLIFALGLRFYLLLFGKASAHWRDLIPARDFLRSASAMLRFYLSFGRTALPRWYAHNPLWGPIYLALFIVLASQVVTGVGIGRGWLAGELAVAWHGVGAKLIGIFTGLHLLAIFSHDLRGTGSDVSAMINGHRIFVIPDTRSPLEQIDTLERGHETASRKRS